MNNLDAINEYVYKYWFPKGFEEEIFIVCSCDETPTYDAHKYSDEYVYLDNFDDKDLLFLVYGFICRFYPKAKIKYFFTDKYINEHQNDWDGHNLIILGGPSSKHETARHFMHDALKLINNRINSIDMPPFMYSIKNSWGDKKKRICGNCSKYSNEYDCHSNHSICLWLSQGTDEPQIELYPIKRENRHEILIRDKWKNKDGGIDEKELPKKLQGRIEQIDTRYYVRDCISEDVAMFAAFRNPYNINKRVIMINGAHTLGGVGAFRSFDITDDETNIASHNYSIVDFILGDKGNDFIAFFPITVDEYAYILNRKATLTNKNIIKLFNNKDEQLAKQSNIEKLLNKALILRSQLEAHDTIDANSDDFEQRLYNIAIDLLPEINNLIKNLSSTVGLTVRKLGEYQKEFDIYFSKWEKAKR